MTARTLTEIRQDTDVLLARDPDHGARRTRRRIAGESRRRNRGAA